MEGGMRVGGGGWTERAREEGRSRGIREGEEVSEGESKKGRKRGLLREKDETLGYFLLVLLIFLYSCVISLSLFPVSRSCFLCYVFSAAFLLFSSIFFWFGKF